jgi:hypothetical protein
MDNRKTLATNNQPAELNEALAGFARFLRNDPISSQGELQANAEMAEHVYNLSEDAAKTELLKRNLDTESERAKSTFWRCQTALKSIEQPAHAQPRNITEGAPAIQPAKAAKPAVLVPLSSDEDEAPPSDKKKKSKKEPVAAPNMKTAVDSLLASILSTADLSKYTQESLGADQTLSESNAKEQKNCLQAVCREIVMLTPQFPQDFKQIVQFISNNTLNTVPKVGPFADRAKKLMDESKVLLTFNTLVADAKQLGDCFTLQDLINTLSKMDPEFLTGMGLLGPAAQATLLRLSLPRVQLIKGTTLAQLQKLKNLAILCSATSDDRLVMLDGMLLILRWLRAMHDNTECVAPANAVPITGSDNQILVAQMTEMVSNIQVTPAPGVINASCFFGEPNQHFMFDGVAGNESPPLAAQLALLDPIFDNVDTLLPAAQPSSPKRKAPTKEKLAELVERLPSITIFELKHCPVAVCKLLTFDHMRSMSGETLKAFAEWRCKDYKLTDDEIALVQASKKRKKGGN